MKSLAALFTFIIIFIPSLSFANDDLCRELAPKLKNGDLIFVKFSNRLMEAVSRATDSWTNHVGMAFRAEEGWRVYESIFPHSGGSTLCEYLRRTRNQQVEIRRLKSKLSFADKMLLWGVMQTKLGVAYDLTFDFNSKGQYCSKLVYQVYKTALGIEIGKIQTFRELYEEVPEGSQKYFDYWFLGKIPWERETITPKSQLLDPHLKTIWSWEQGRIESTENAL